MIKRPRRYYIPEMRCLMCNGRGQGPVASTGMIIYCGVCSGRGVPPIPACEVLG